VPLEKNQSEDGLTADDEEGCKSEARHSGQVDVIVLVCSGRANKPGRSAVFAPCWRGGCGGDSWLVYSDHGT
jgi:hypothetical protein